MVMSGYTSRLWPRDSQPQFWTKYQVWEWLQQVMDMHQIDASSIPFQNFDMDGHQLCSLSYQDFIRAAGSVGHILYHSITELKWGGASESLRGDWSGGEGWLVSIKEKLADLSASGMDSRWSVVEEGSQSRSGVTPHGAVEGGERLLKAKEMMDLLFALGRAGLLTKHRGDVAEKLSIFLIRVWGVVVRGSSLRTITFKRKKLEEIHDAWCSCATVCGRWHLNTKVVTGKPSTTGLTSIQYAKDNHTRAQRRYCSYLFLRKKKQLCFTGTRCYIFRYQII